MRGASALQQVLNDVPNPQVRLFIVWEPVIVSDLWPPTSFVLSRVTDRRAMQFWDGSTSLSRSMLAAEENSWLLPQGESPSPDMIVWDFVAVFPPGPTWGSQEPPSSHCEPVVHCIEEIRKDLLAQVK